MIEVERAGDIWTITLNRPGKANALTADMLHDLAQAAEAAVVAKLVILTGRGRVFSAGADLEEARAGLASSPLWERASTAFAALPGLSIAALNGTLAGGAFGMALACDLRITVPGAGFFYPVMKLGFLPQPSDPVRLRALIGPSRAKLILMAGARLTAQEALQYGLVDGIVPDDRLIAQAHAWGADALGASMGHIGAIKGLVG